MATGLALAVGDFYLGIDALMNLVLSIAGVDRLFGLSGLASYPFTPRRLKSLLALGQTSSI